MIPALGYISFRYGNLSVRKYSPVSDQAKYARSELSGAVHLHRHDRLQQLPDAILTNFSKGSLGGLVERPLRRVDLVGLL